MKKYIFCAGALLVSVLSAMAEHSGPWDIAALSKAPHATWGEAREQIQEVYYDGEIFKGKPTRVFAYYGRPDGPGPFPGVVLVHGGGGAAFRDWVKHWVQNGYVALAMDLAGKGPAGPLPDGGPDQDDANKFPDFGSNGAKDVWTYQAVAAVIRGHSLLASLKEVDPNRTALTGISWGGYLTCIVAGLDHRFKAAVPVYGCGYIHEKSAWVGPNFSKMSGDLRQRWIDNFEPSRYLGQARCPMLFMNGTSDFAYPLESYQKSYELVKAPVTLSIQINRPHGHIWTFPEVDAFIDCYLKKGEPLLSIGPMKIEGDKAAATIADGGTVVKAQLDYAIGQDRVWKTVSAEVKGKTISLNLPAERPLVCYFNVTDSRGLTVSNPHIELAQDLSGLSHAQYPDGRPSATLRMDANDQGVILKHGDGPGKCDILGAREALIFEENGVYHLFYDGAGPKGWLACLATSKDLKVWEKKGPVLDFGKPGESDSASASSPWVYRDGPYWHMFYLGTPHASGAPDLIPSFPYLTLKARSKSLAGPWIKQPEVIPFRTKPGTYYKDTASPGHIVKQGEEYLMFFRASMKRTLGIARTKDLNGPWAIDPKPIVPPEEQIENSSLYFEPSNKTWFLFTNHIGLDGNEYTDAVWVYWSKDLNTWDTKNKAVVLDGKNCGWSKKCIGMPSVIAVGKRLAIFYDGPGGNSTSHMQRDVGLAWLNLPLAPPVRSIND